MLCQTDLGDGDLFPRGCDSHCLVIHSLRGATLPSHSSGHGSSDLRGTTEYNVPEPLAVACAGGSRLFTQEKPWRVAGFRGCSLVLKALSTGVCSLILSQFWPPEIKLTFHCINGASVRGLVSHVCENLPLWLRQPWWDPNNDTCYVDSSEYTECLDESPWYQNGVCNLLAADCQLNAALPVWLQNVVYFAAGLFLIALVLQALAAAVWCCTSCCFKTQSKPEPVNVSVAARNGQVSSVSFTDQAKLLIFKIGPTVLDVFSDVNGIAQFVLTGNFQFAAASAFIFVASLYQQVQRGAVKNFYKVCAESLSQGAATDELELILLSEKTVEAPMQFLIQIYAVLFVTSREFAVGSFCFSLALSLYGMAGAAFDLIELDLWPVFRERDYAVLS